MDTVEYWRLADDDRELVEPLAAGLGHDAARVLAYLLLRRDTDRIEEPRATEMQIRIGTELSRKAVKDSLSRLETRRLVDRTSVQRSERGRPPTAWEPAHAREATLERVFETHANALLDQSAAIADVPRSSETENGSSQTDLVVAVNWLPNALQLPLYAADDAGAYAERNLDVTFDYRRGSHLALESLLDGRADIGLIGAGSVVRALAAERPIVPIAVLYQRTTTVLYTIQERFGEPFESVDQLRGCRVITTEGSETCLLAKLFLSQADLLDDVEFVDADGEERSALLSGDADVATGSFSDPLELGDEMSVDVLPIGDHFPIYGPTLVVRKAAFVESDDPWSRFLAGTVEGWSRARDDPEPAAAIVAGETDDAVTTVRRLFEHAVETYGLRDVVRNEGWGWQTPETWERLEVALRQGDLLGETR